MDEEQIKKLAKFMHQIDVYAMVGAFNSTKHKGMWDAWIDFRDSIGVFGHPTEEEYQEKIKGG